MRVVTKCSSVILQDIFIVIVWCLYHYHLLFNHTKHISIALTNTHSKINQCIVHAPIINKLSAVKSSLDLIESESMNTIPAEWK